MKIKTFIAYAVVFVLGFGCCALILKTVNNKPITEYEKSKKSVSVITDTDDLVGGNQVQQAAEKISEYVVNIDTVGIVQDYQSYFSMPQEVKGRASGVIISEDGYILTNNHVVENAKNIKFAIGEKEYKAQIIDTDKNIDIALLKTDDIKNVPVLIIGNSDKISNTEEVYAIGAPGGLDKTVTKGIISNKSSFLIISFGSLLHLNS